MKPRRPTVSMRSGRNTEGVRRGAVRPGGRERPVHRADISTSASLWGVACMGMSITSEGEEGNLNADLAAKNAKGDKNKGRITQLGQAR
jgi:hypothetical protein